MPSRALSGLAPRFQTPREMDARGRGRGPRVMLSDEPITEMIIMAMLAHKRDGYLLSLHLGPWECLSGLRLRTRLSCVKNK